MLGAVALAAGMAVAVPAGANAAMGPHSEPGVAGANVQAAAEATEVQILGINDFHGRIQANGQEAGAAVLAGAVDDLRDVHPNTVFAAAGDLIGASTFESFIAHDKPTIDALNAAGLDVSAVGNHEFDQGFDDLKNRVIEPYDPDTNPYGGAQWHYLGANVTYRDTGDPALEPTWVRAFGDVEVGFVGAVTEHLPELVSPAGIADIEVTDIADAVNTEATRLKNEGVDIVVMLVHEGAPTTDCSSVTDPGNDFGAIVTQLNADVDAVISGHTHLTYNCLVEVPAWETADRAVTARPVVSAGQYGYNLDQLLFTVSADGEVTGVESNTIPLTREVPDPDEPGETMWVPNYPANDEVTSIVDAAVAEAEVLGAVPLGEIAGPFNRAKTASGDENRGGESTLGNLVAQAQLWATGPDNDGDAQIAFMNPGGLRADMQGNNAGGYPAELTYKQAATVQPFANTLVNMTLTGAQIKQVLEQQWQPEGASRPFLRLGISEGFQYTYDPDAPKGDHVLGMWLDGEPIQPDAEYSVTANSFLAAGGDNFTELANGTDPTDTGRIDLQAMVDFMAEMAPEGDPLPVDNSQRSVGVHFATGAAGLPGTDVSFDLSSLSMSTGTATDDTVTVSLAGDDLGTFDVTTTVGEAKDDEVGTAQVTVPLPAALTLNETILLTVTGDTTGTSAQIPLTVGFVDVAQANPFAEDIYWLVDHGIALGYTDGSFKPLAVVTRQAMAGLIYRLPGEGGQGAACDPATERAFTDVPADNPFCGAIEVLAGTGVVRGYGDGTYHPVQAVSRQAMSAYLYRLWSLFQEAPGSADPTCSANEQRAFSDVPADNPFCGTIEWMAEQGITRGYGDGTFRPLDGMTRQAMAAMLHRFATGAQGVPDVPMDTTLPSR